MKTLTKALWAIPILAALLFFTLATPPLGDASSHREAPMISTDPLADNTDVYAFRSPDNDETVTIIANYIPLELPEGGPNYHNFGENIRYEIHIKNDATTTGDDILYRFTFDLENEDPSTFFNIRLGAQNLKATYTLEKSTDNGQTFNTIVSDGVVPPNNIGPRSIEGAAGLNTTYSALVQDAITTAQTGETVFVGPRDDPFFVDLGGIFDLGGVRSEFCENPANANCARDAVAGFNTHSIVMQIPINMLQKDGLDAADADNILDGDFVIGVWASASRPQMRTLSFEGEEPTYSGPWIQVSRLGMPLTNEAVIPIGEKDYWNSRTPYDEGNAFYEYFYNPELALYMDDDQFGGAVPALSALRIQENSLGAFDFTNGADGLFGLKGSDAVEGTALDDDLFGNLLLPGAGMPRSVDIWPAFFVGVPNVPPYQLATGKGGDPLAAGKPFANNFLPAAGDMLRLNMAVPVTDRSSDDFSTLGLVQAAVLGLTDPRFTDDAELEFIPNMDGFPNGRRLEDDVTRIELQAVSGIVLAAIGLWYDDYDPNSSPSPVTQDLQDVLGFVAGPYVNDKPIDSTFPFVPEPHRGYDYVKDLTADNPLSVSTEPGVLGMAVPEAFILDQNYPNPFNPTTTIEYQVKRPAQLAVRVYDVQGRLIETLVDRQHTAGQHAINWDASGLASGTYFYRIEMDGRVLPAKKALLIK
ncbi:MAG TPA: DUF4331 family protein [Rhodothermales bacterium]|nr:DUF4331 family protein [Rhodothermales bacterium]